MVDRLVLVSLDTRLHTHDCPENWVVQRCVANSCWRSGDCRNRRNTEWMDNRKDSWRDLRIWWRSSAGDCADINWSNLSTSFEVELYSVRKSTVVGRLIRRLSYSGILQWFTSQQHSTNGTWPWTALANVIIIYIHSNRLPNSSSIKSSNHFKNPSSRPTFPHFFGYDNHQISNNYRLHIFKPPGEPDNCGYAIAYPTTPSRI